MSKSPGPGSKSDPAFASAVESAYLHELSKLSPGEGGLSIDALHSELLAQAIHAADRTNGGLRLKKLDAAGELETRLRRALSVRLGR